MPKYNTNYKRRDTNFIIIDILLSCRLPATMTQAMWSANLDWRCVIKFMNKCIKNGLIEHRVNPRPEASHHTRADRINKGWDEKEARTPSNRGKNWYKTTDKGEKHIKSYRKLWEAFDKHPEYIGLLSYETVGCPRRGHGYLECPIKKKQFPHLGGFDIEWVERASNVGVHIEQQSMRGDVYIQQGLGDEYIKLQKMADERYRKNRKEKGLPTRNTTSRYPT